MREPQVVEHHGQVGEIRPERAWALLSQTRTFRDYERRSDADYGGFHIGYAHQSRFCTYLNPRKDHNPTNRVIELTGEILDVIRWCAKCSPGIVPKPSVEILDERRSGLDVSRIIEVRSQTSPRPHGLVL